MTINRVNLYGFRDSDLVVLTVDKDIGDGHVLPAGTHVHVDDAKLGYAAGYVGFVRYRFRVTRHEIRHRS